MLALCLCSTVLLMYMLAIGIFLAAVVVQRRSDKVVPKYLHLAYRRVYVLRISRPHRVFMRPHNWANYCSHLLAYGAL
jgi:hypothetical protein